MDPVLSIVIPMHNAEATIEAALRSLAESSLENWEAIVVDDGSRDLGPAIVAALARDDERIRLLRLEHGERGPGAARNLGIQASRGRYVAFLNADDWYLPGGLERLLATAAESRNGAAFGAAEWFDALGRPFDFVDGPSCPFAGLDELLRSPRFAIHACVVARSTLGDVRFDESLAACEDLDFWLRLAERGVRFAAVHDSVAAFRCVPGSRSRNIRASLEAIEQVIDGSMGRAIGSGWSERGVDLSARRRDELLRSHALRCATAASFDDPTMNTQRAAGYFRHFAEPLCIEPEEAAAAAYWALPGAACLAPSAWSGPIEFFCTALDRWWRRCESEGWGGPGFVEEATRALAAWMADPREVAQRIAARVEPGSRVMLLGFGRNAAVLVPMLAARGCAIEARDDSTEAPSRITVNGASISVSPLDGPLDAAARHIVTTTIDEPIMARMPAGLDLIRWSEARLDLERNEFERLREAWIGLDPEPAVGIAA